jgi:hypothetical protein
MSLFEDFFEGRRRNHGYDGYGHDGHERHGHEYGREYPPAQGPGIPATTATCGGCKAPVALMPGFRFCPYCGGRLAGQAACPGCGAARAEGAAFCPGCGTKL